MRTAPVFIPTTRAILWISCMTSLGTAAEPLPTHDSSVVTISNKPVAKPSLAFLRCHMLARSPMAVAAGG